LLNLTHVTVYVIRRLNEYKMPLLF